MRFGEEEEAEARFFKVVVVVVSADMFNGSGGGNESGSSLFVCGDFITRRIAGLAYHWRGEFEEGFEW